MARKRRKGKLVKRLIQALVLAAFAIGLTWYFLPAAVPVQTEEARLGNLVSAVEAAGHTRARDRYLVWAPVAGTLQRLPVAVGDPVVAEQLLARIVPDPAALADAQTARQLAERMAAAEAAKAAAVAEQARATAALDQVRADLRNTEQLASTGQAGAVQREQAQLAVKLAFKDLETAGLAVEAAAHDIAAARAALAQLRQGTGLREWIVRAPRNGTVLRIAAGRTVATGAPLIEIGNPKDLEVVVETGAVEAASISVGQRAVITPAGAADGVEGRVRRIGSVGAAEGAEPQHAQLVIEFNAPPARWQHLGDGHEVRARIATAVMDNVLKVPAKAVFADGSRSAVYVVENGRARKRHVSIGARNADEAVIQGGLREYELVVVAPGPQVRDSARVKTR